jgi:hypothetical protein
MDVKLGLQHGGINIGLRFKNRAQSKIFGSKRDEVIGNLGGVIIEIFVICTPHQILFR